MAGGRPREFDIDQAVASVLPIFLAKGYEGATFGELISVMKITPPSFYAAFGSKEGLFERAMDLYAKKSATIRAQAMASPNAFDALKSLLQLLATAYTQERIPHGCLFVQGALVCSDKAQAVRDRLAEARSMTEVAVRKRLKQAEEENDESVHGNVDQVACLIATIASGMAVQAVGGTSRDELLKLIDLAMEAISPKKTGCPPQTDNSQNM